MPDSARAWDRDDAALAAAIVAGRGLATIAVKSASAPRLMETAALAIGKAGRTIRRGHRAGVDGSSADLAARLLEGAGVQIIRYLRSSGMFIV